MASLSQFGGSLPSEVFSSLLLGLPTGDYYLLTLPSLYFIYGKITFTIFLFLPVLPKFRLCSLPGCLRSTPLYTLS